MSSFRRDDKFFFAFLNSQKPTTARKVHIRQLYDVMQLCIHRSDFDRAQRAWSILARCKEVTWMGMWTTGLLLLQQKFGGTSNGSHCLEYLRTMMLRNPSDRENILCELVVQLIQLGRDREALDELELYLPSYPYQSNPILHLYAGMICLRLAQPVDTSDAANVAVLKEAQKHFKHAKNIGCNDIVAQAFFDKALVALDNQQRLPGGELDSEDDSVPTPNDAESPGHKRART